jgi:FixJ family two-component response regulator
VSESPDAVFIIDDDVSFRQSVKRLLASAGYQVEAFGSAEEFLRCEFIKEPACVLLDLAMPGMDGLTLQSRLGELGREPPIVFVSGHGEVPSSVQAMKAGAMDFLTKPVDEVVLLSAVSEALEVHRERLEARRQIAEARTRVLSLTPRENEVAALVVQGKRNKQIAFELGIAEKTVKVHRSRVMEKIGARSTVELVRLWLRVRPADDIRDG